MTIGVGGTRVWTATFGAEIALVAGTSYALTVWDTSGSHYTSFNSTISTGSESAGYVLPAAQYGVNTVSGQYVQFCPYAALNDIYGIYAAGDAAPTSVTPTLGFPIEPTVN